MHICIKVADVEINITVIMIPVNCPPSKMLYNRLRLFSHFEHQGVSGKLICIYDKITGYTRVSNMANEKFNLVSLDTEQRMFIYAGNLPHIDEE